MEAFVTSKKNPMVVVGSTPTSTVNNYKIHIRVYNFMNVSLNLKKNSTVSRISSSNK